MLEKNMGIKWSSASALYKSLRFS